MYQPSPPRKKTIITNFLVPSNPILGRVLYECRRPYGQYNQIPHLTAGVVLIELVTKIFLDGVSD